VIERPLVLVVDDEPQIQRFLRHSLTAAGYDVEQAATGRTRCVSQSCAIRRSLFWISVSPTWMASS
jgi:CheY-like chemotaxis protein